MGQPVVHFEVIGQDGEKLRAFYAELFGWRIDTGDREEYGLVARDENLDPDGIGIGGGVGDGPEGYAGHATFYVGVPDVEVALAQAESLGGSRMFGPQRVQDGVVVGLFEDPEGHVVGVASS